MDGPYILPEDDPYAQRPSFWRKHESAVWAVFVCIVTVVLTVLSFPPYKTPEFAYAFAAPAIFWAYLRPSFKLYARTIFVAQAVAWWIMLGWLHNVTWGGIVLLGPLVGAWVGVWYLAVWWTIPRIHSHAPMMRVLGMLGLAGLWVVLEWSRTWLLSGFPWLPLASSQWERSIMLQIASFTGAYGISFVLIFFNLGFAAYGFRLIREKHRGLKRRSVEFMAALMVLMFTTFPLLPEVFNQDRQPWLRLSLVQPYVPQTVKWDPAMGPGIINMLEDLTLKAARQQPDIILWPEAVTPWAVKGSKDMRAFVESLSARSKRPIVLGSIGIENFGEENEEWYNAVFAVTPFEGVFTGYYAKRHLVPYGEYVPLRPILGGLLTKFAGVGDDFHVGEDSHPLVIPWSGGSAVLGPLICYEDIYPQLARSSVITGAELLTVHSNTVWFGQSGATIQHLAHSVLRAVETRRPVVRVGNGGWSGWIDEFGNVRETVTDENDNIYFRGTELVKVSRDKQWIGYTSFYVKHGDWFVLLCAVLVVLARLLIVFIRPPEEPV